MPDNDVLIIGAPDVEAALRGREKDILETVGRAYETHSAGDSSLPHSSFLRFPDSDKDRIICLPAYLGGDYQLAGMKWIASVPDNVARGMERASAVIVLNERKTGRPKTVMEGSIVSKVRTAASAALASKVLAPEAPSRIGFVGCGPINVAVAQFLRATWPDCRDYQAFDLDPARAKAFGDSLLAAQGDAQFSVADSLDALMADCPMVAFATTAITPYVDNLDGCPEGATILHVSLRDLKTGAILPNHNVVDDLDHVCRAGTSIYLSAEEAGNRDFVHASIGDILRGAAELPARDGRPVVFSPFGLGVLDLAVAELVLAEVGKSGGGTRAPNFLP